jgi:glutathione S-transferase
MNELIHHPYCPHSRFIRLVLYEYDMPVELIGERIWEHRKEFLIFNPAGTLPVLLIDGQPPVPDVAIIAEYLDEVYGEKYGNLRLLPAEPNLRVEVRRLMYWFNDKFFADVSGPFTAERFKQYMPVGAGGGSPDHALLRAARENIPDHLAYIASLMHRHNWLTGDRLTYADLAAAAHLSVCGNPDSLPWPDSDAAKTWFARLQSRASFRSMLAEGWKGFART